MGGGGGQMGRGGGTKSEFWAGVPEKKIKWAGGRRKNWAGIGV